MQGMLQIGQRVGNWIVEGHLGQGNRGSVFSVSNEHASGLKAALKVLDVGEDDEALHRCVREVELLGRLEHPGIVRVRDLHVDPPWAYVVMEQVEGLNLRQLLQVRPLSHLESCGLACQLADALASAHRQRVWHRDVKPSNVLLRNDGRVVIVDFDFAIAADSVPISSPEVLPPATVYYAAPEWLRRGRLDLVAWDVWSAGVVLQEMLTGAPPFSVRWLGNRRDSLQELFRAKVRDTPLDPGAAFPHVLRDLVRGMTSPAPEERLRDMRHVADVLGHCLRVEGMRPLEVSREVARDVLGEGPELSGRREWR